MNLFSYIRFLRGDTTRAKGFTLIELLVVIAIIGLLASIVFSSLSGARVKARDANRKSDLKQIQAALELYFVKYGQYPCATAGCASNSVTNLSPGSNAITELITAKAFSTFPNDPTNSNSGSCNNVGKGYCYCSIGGNSYVLSIDTEDDKGGSARCYESQGNIAAICNGHHSGANIAADLCTSR